MTAEGRPFTCGIGVWAAQSTGAVHTDLLVAERSPWVPLWAGGDAPDLWGSYMPSL